jgi:pimeloyl-ACP methyl ester carboxylesterase
MNESATTAKQEADRLQAGFVDGYLETPDVRLHYTEWNPTGGRPALLVHGVNVQLHTWDPIAAVLSEDRRVVSVDLRGHGDSSWPASGYAIDKFVADLKALADALDLAPFDYIGHSLGARIGLAYAGEHPDTLAHLVLSDTGPEMPRSGAEFSQRIVGSTGDVRGFKNREQVLEHYAKMHPEWEQVFLELHADHQVRENWAGKLVFKSDPDLFWLAGSAGAREIPYIWEVTERISVPTLILWGLDSPFLDADLVARMEAAIPDTTLARTHTGHYIPREKPDEFLAEVRKFLDG